MTSITSNLPKPLRRPYVLVYRDGPYTVAVNEKGRKIASDIDATIVFRNIIEYFIEKWKDEGMPTPKPGGIVYIKHGRYKLRTDLIFPKENIELYFIGEGKENTILELDSTKILYEYAHYPIYRMITFMRLGIHIYGEYIDETILMFGGQPPLQDHTELHSVTIVLKAKLKDYKSSGYVFFCGTNGGPVGYAVRWSDVTFVDQNQSDVSYDIYMWRIWVEGFEVDKMQYLINTPHPLGRGFAYIVGNVWAKIKNVVIWSSSISGKLAAFICANVPLILENCELPALADFHYGHILATGKPIILRGVIRLQEVGPIIFPIVRMWTPNNGWVDAKDQVVSTDYKYHNVSVLSGDGTKTIFKLGTHKLRELFGFEIKDSSQVRISCSPASPDAINAAPVVCYLQDDDGDGIYEGVYAKFASAPAPGTNNVKVVWEIEYIG